jgi:methyl-accepting chemotaxis protein
MALRIRRLLSSIGAPSFAPSDPIGVLAAVQGLTLKSAVASASTAVRLDAVRIQSKQVSASLEQMLRTVAELNTRVQHVAAASGKTLAAAGEMKALSIGGRDLSKRAMDSSAELQTQMQATVRHIDKLVRGVTSIIRVSDTIESIARETTLLSFNATIEAARAGEQGRGFAVVAAEVRSRAQHTEVRTKEIRSILDGLSTELTPTREALQVSCDLVTTTTAGVLSAGESLERIAELATHAHEDMHTVATVVNELREGIGGVFDSLKTATASSETISTAAQALVQANFAVSQMVEQCFGQFGKIDMDTQFHRGLRKARELSQQAREIFERAIDGGLCSLEDVLAYDYREIKGAQIQSLGRLFNVSRVPAEGFSPPKYSTRYDSVVDVDIRRAMDEVKASELSLLYATVCDINLYMPSHHSECCRDWTGIPEKDLSGNRVKRFFYDRWANTESVRVGMGPNSKDVPNRASREQFTRAGCEMLEQADSKGIFNVRVYVRDATAIVVVVTTPIYVKGQRYGGSAVGWLESGELTLDPTSLEPMYRRFLRPIGAAASHATTSPLSALAEVQALTIKSAVATVATARSLDSVNAKIEQTASSLDETLSIAEELRTRFRRVSTTSARTLSAAGEMVGLSTHGRSLSQQAVNSSAELRIQMQATAEHIQKLVTGVTAIIQVSESIRLIARQTTMLSFNAAIEAARAGARGRGFALVAAEVRSLAQHTQTRSKEIQLILDELATEMAPAQHALEASRELIESADAGVRSVSESLDRIATLATDADGDMNGVAQVMNALSAGIDSVFVDLNTASGSAEAIARHAEAFVTRNFEVAEIANQCFVEFGKIHGDTQFHRALGRVRKLSQSVRHVFERAIATGRCTLDDVLQYEYREIKGADIQQLSRLFDVSRVPYSGFDPPKYSTRYDAEVDVDIQRVMDQVKASEPGLLYATVMDLNLYMPIHHAQFCHDWTGNKEQDDAGNRAKRFFYDRWVRTEGTRLGLGPNAKIVPNRASRDQFLEAGCQMREQPDSEDLFRIGFQIRGANTVVLAVQVPLFVQGYRYGSAACGWIASERSPTR